MGCACKQGCSSCSLTASAWRGDPLAARLVSDEHTIGGFLPTFVTQDSVRQLKARLDPLFTATDADVKACSEIDSRERAAWDGFLASWKQYRAADESWWGVKSEYDTGLLFEESLSRWQKQLEGRCKLAAPRVVTESELTDLSPVKWAAVAVIAVAVVYGVHTVLK